MKKTEIKRLTPAEKEIIELLRQSAPQTNSFKEKKKKKKPKHDIYFVLPDAHYPFQDEELMKKVRECIKDNPPAGVVINGDWLDLFTLGSYNANSLGLLRDIDLSVEYAAGLAGIEELEKVLPEGARKMFLFGNHEDRYYREINKGDISKYGAELIDPVQALKLVEKGWEVKTNWKDDYFTVGDVDIVHGMYTNIHVAKKHLDMHRGNIILGHCHRFQSFYTGDQEAHAIGCLCDMSNKAFGYMPRLQREVWSNGFAVITVVDGKSYVNPVAVRNGNFEYNGKIY